jgi:RNA methyltransferase, TrmH family
VTRHRDTAGPGRVSPAELARLRASRDDPRLVRLEGVHALKHAVRFGADVEVVVSPDPTALQGLLRRFAPDVVLPVPVHVVAPGTWRALTGRELPSPALAVARRPAVTAGDVLAAAGRVVVLEDPRHLGNLGAVVRVAAAAGAGGVLVVGTADPWHPTAVRGGAGLQFALPVARTDALPEERTDAPGGRGASPAGRRPLVALTADGAPLSPGALAADAVLLVGTEREGLTPALRARATQALAIPMRPGVASLNLATAVAVALYAP